MLRENKVISVKGKKRIVPCFRYGDISIIVTGHFFKIARVFDEAWIEAAKLPNPGDTIETLKEVKDTPHIFTFTQRLPDLIPKYLYPYEMENLAVATITSYSEWFEKQVDRSVRKHVKKAKREGLIAKIVPFDDRLIEGISSIYSELKVRQGRPFWHYGKSLQEVKEENATYLARSVFIGLYFEDELVGFLKFVVDGEVGTIMQILSKSAHFPKRPTNALISKAIEVCESMHIRYLIYGEHSYGKKRESSLINFKEKNGFKRRDYPRYYVPLTAFGKIGIKLGIHRGYKNLMPAKARKSLVTLRTQYYESLRNFSGKTGETKQPKKTPT